MTRARNPPTASGSSPVLNLDPTDNDQLSEDLWERLMSSIEKRMLVSDISCLPNNANLSYP